MKTKLLALILLCSFGMYAQSEKPLTKGNFMLGGAAGFRYQNYNDIRSANLNLYPSVAYFFIDNFACGISPSLQYHHSKTGGITNANTSLGFGVMARYYFQNSLYLDLSTGLSNITFDDEKIRTFVSPGVGYAYFINQKVSLDFKLGYQRYFSDGSDYGVLSSGIGMQIFL